MLVGLANVQRVDKASYCMCLSNGMTDNDKINEATMRVLVDCVLTSENLDEAKTCRAAVERFSRGVKCPGDIIDKMCRSIGARRDVDVQIVGLIGWWIEVKGWEKAAVKKLCDTAERSHGRDVKKAAKDALSRLVGVFGHKKVMEAGSIVENIAKAIDRSQALDALKAETDVVQDLSYISNVVLPAARKLDSSSKVDKLTAQEASFKRKMVVECWTLAIPFCKMADDVAEAEKLIPNIVKAMGDAKYELVREGGECLKGLALRFNDQLKGISPKVVTSLFNLSDKAKSTAEAKMVVNIIIVWVQQTKPNVDNVFKKLMQRLLTAIQPPIPKDREQQVVRLLNLTRAIMGAVERDDDISLVYRTVKTIIKSGLCSKITFQILHLILSSRPDIVRKDGHDSFLEMINSSTVGQDVAGREGRLKCLELYTEVSGADDGNFAAEAVGEVVLCLKDTNKKVREAAYNCLGKMCDNHKDTEEFLKIVVGSLGAKTPHMRSAGVMALSRLIFERRDCEVTRGMVGKLLEVVCLLFREKAREVIKAAVSFVRVAIHSLSKEDLHPLLTGVVEGLMMWNTGKDKFRSKIKIILKILIRMYGAEEIGQLVPKEDSRLVTHIRKVDERERRRRKGRAEGEEDDDDDMMGEFEDMMDSEEFDSDLGKTLVSGMTKMTKMSRMSKMTGQDKSRATQSVKSRASKLDGGGPGRVKIKGDDSGVVDMLDSGTNVKWVGGDDEQYDEFGDDDDDNDIMEFDDTGRLIVNGGEQEPESEVGESSDAAAAGDDDDDDGFEGGQGSGKYGLEKLNNAMKYEKAMSRDREHAKKKRRLEKTSAPGAMYKAKKAGGDVRRKGDKFEPYAYIPLAGKKYTKKFKGGAIKEMAQVVRSKGKRKRR